MRKLKEYLTEERQKRKSNSVKINYTNLERIMEKKFSLDDKIIFANYIRSFKEEGDFAFTELKKDTEPMFLAYCTATEFANMDPETRKKGDEQYDCVYIRTPWFNVFDTNVKLRKKYFKGDAFKEEKHNNWDHNFLPNNNKIYKWVSDWEYEVDPMDHRNLKSFMKARVLKIKELRGEVLKEKIKLLELKQAENERLKKEEIRIEKIEKQIQIKQMREERYENLDLATKEPGVYVICEINKTLTKLKNKCNCLYVGESKNISKRLSAYEDINKKNNELVEKIARKTKLPTDVVRKKLVNNVHVRKLKFSNMHNDNQRKEIESYLIHRLKPLANTSSRNSVYARRSFISPDIVNREDGYSAYKESAEDFFLTECYKFGDTKTLFNRKTEKWVKRDSVEGEEAEEINCQKAFKTWFKKFDKEEFYEMWVEDKATSLGSPIVEEWMKTL